jgi:formylmethanofuran dehydrogenase subunit B
MPAGLHEALEEARRLLATSDAPVFLVGGGLTTEALRAAVQLALAHEATWSPVPGPSLAEERSGLDAPEFGATLGEVRGTADLVIFWRADPQRTHPRHLERFSFFPPLLDGSLRSLVVVDTMSAEENLTVEHAAEVLGFEAPGDRGSAVDTEIVRGLRCLLERAESPDAESSLALVIEALARRLGESRHAHFFLGDSAAACPALWGQLQRLAAGSRPGRRVTVSALQGPGNLRGLLEVPAWLTGCSTKMVLRGGGPVLLPGSLGGNQILRDGAADLVVLLGADPASLTAESRRLLAETRRIVVGPGVDRKAPVSIRIPGLDPRLSAGVIRSDGLHLTLDGRSRQGSPTADPAVAILQHLEAGPQRSGRSGSAGRAS